MIKNFFLLMLLVISKNVLPMGFGLSPRLIERRDSIAEIIEKNYLRKSYQLDAFDATILATVSFVEDCTYIGNLLNQLEYVRSKFNNEGPILEICNDGICQVNARMMNFALKLSPLEIRARDELAISIKTGRPELSKEDSIVIASTFFLKNKDYVPFCPLFLRLEQIHSKFDKSSSIYKICEVQLEKLYDLHSMQVRGLF